MGNVSTDIKITVKASTGFYSRHWEIPPNPVTFIMYSQQVLALIISRQAE